MTNTHLPILTLLLLFCGARPVSAQNDGAKYLSGRVISMREGQPVGVPDVKVAIRDHAWDITDGSGSFRLPLPAGQDFINIELTNTAFQMISPYSGIVNLPPDENFQILVCGEQNLRLREQVEQLNKKIQGYEKGRQLNLRQLVAMHRTLLDTVLHYENIVLKKEAEIAKLEIRNAALTNEMQAKTKEIAELQESVRSLLRQLTAALEEKYLRQKKYFDEIALVLDDYTDEAKNLRDNLRPEFISGYFLPQNEPFRQELYKKINVYNTARDRAVKLREAHIEAVGHYWDKASLAHEAMDTYSFLLKEVHDKGIYPLEFSVNDNLRRWSMNDVSRRNGLKAAEQAVEENAGLLDSRLAEFEKMKNDFIQHLKLGF